MSGVTVMGLDIAKNVFHAPGASARGQQLFSRRIPRGKVLEFFEDQPRCLVALEACGGAHHWARELMRMGYVVRLIPPAYVKPFVKRQKNDAADAPFPVTPASIASATGSRTPSPASRTGAGSRPDRTDARSSSSPPAPPPRPSPIGCES